MNIELVGILAAALTTVAWLPQTARVVKTRSTGDLSWMWIAMTLSGVALWLVYGIVKDSPALIGGNAIGLANLIVILAYKFYCNPEVPKVATGEELDG